LLSGLSPAIPPICEGHVFKNDPDKAKGLSAVLEFVVWCSDTGAECLAAGLAEGAPSSAPPQAYERVADNITPAELAVKIAVVARTGSVSESFMWHPSAFREADSCVNGP